MNSEIQKNNSLNAELDSLIQKVVNAALEVTPILSFPNPPSALPMGCGLCPKI